MSKNDVRSARAPAGAPRRPLPVRPLRRTLYCGFCADGDHGGFFEVTHDPDETDTFFYLSFEVSLAEIQLNRCPDQRWQELLLVEFSAAFRDDGQFIDPVELVGEVVQRGKTPGAARLSFKYDKENRTLEIAEVDPKHREQLLKQFGWLFDR